MTSEHKKGALRLEGSNPMVLIEAEGEINEASTPEQESIASAVSRTMTPRGIVVRANASREMTV